MLLDEEKTLTLSVYSILTLELREVDVLPHTAWKGSSQGLLGITLHYEYVDDGRGHGLRVLEVFPHSPAHDAGLTPGYDYLIQMVYNNRILRDIQDLKDECHK